MARLYVVATPIGNLGDLSPRMAEALAGADLIAAEDTRVTMKILNHLGISKPMISCHRHNEVERSAQLARRMASENLTVALTCDAGTPGISDPGSLVVAAAREAGIEIVPIAGPSAVATAVSAAGFDAREFAFYGFLPREKKPLREKLAAILETGIPVAVIYESPHRVRDLLAEMARAWPGALVSAACDLTKHYERIQTGPIEDVARALDGLESAEKGEYCLTADLSRVPRPEKATEPISIEARLLSRMLEGESLEDAAGALNGVKRNDLYRAKLRIRTFLEGNP